MTHLPSIEEIEKRILGIFSQFNIRPNESLPVQSILSVWSETGFNNNDLADGLASLISKGYLEDAGKSSFRLTEKITTNISQVEIPLGAIESQSMQRSNNVFHNILRIIWNDPVWSKVIATVIISVATIVGGYFWISKNKTTISESQNRIIKQNEFPKDTLEDTIKDTPGPPRLILKGWEDAWTFNTSTYDCLYAWPKNENHDLKSDEGIAYYQTHTWSLHPDVGAKNTELSYVLLSTKPVVIKQILLHLKKFKPAPQITDFVMARIDDGCGMGGGSMPRLIFNTLLLKPNKKIYAPTIIKRYEQNTVSSLPYQLNSREGLSFTINIIGSGEFVVNIEAKVTDFSGNDYNVLSRNVRFKRLTIPHNDFSKIPQITLPNDNDVK
jgi:hypothetical protein